MTTTTNNKLLPCLEDTGLEGKKQYTPKERTERLQHYIKRVYDIGIKPTLSCETIRPNNKWTQKEPEIRQDFIWGAGLIAIATITRENSIQILLHHYRETYTTIQRLLHAQTKHFPQSWRFFFRAK